MVSAGKLSGFNLKLFKSAGVPVTAAVHRLLTEANGARDRRDWRVAADAYQQALKHDHELTHIWIQYGHALKEMGDMDSAEAAYRKAVDIAPPSAEAHLHLGHIVKHRGDGVAANRLYLAAARLDPRNPDALAELHRLVHLEGELAPEDLLAIIAPTQSESDLAPDSTGAVVAARASLVELMSAVQQRRPTVDPEARGKLDAAVVLLDEISASLRAESPAPAPDTPTIVYDISDLIAYFRDSRLPTGIQRVQIEIISNSLGRRPIQICCFLPERNAWLEVPPDMFVMLCRLSLAGGDRSAPEWMTALTRLHVLLSVAEAYAFPSGAHLVNLGTSWWISNYFLFIRQAKALSTANIRYIPFVHDLIPLLAAHCCATGLTQDFINWIVGVFEHADTFLTNSESTKRDLISVAKLLKYDLNPDLVHVVRLDADFRKSHAPVAQGEVAKWGLGRNPFILFVSTVEVRKNHVLAFDAWSALIRRYGIKNVPKLVCVGKRGWLDDAIFAKLQAHDELRERVLLLSGLSDTELSSLYKECLFTIYPSTYEGWGLPITESLCHGKVPLTSDGSSLPEAGGDFAVYFEADSLPSLVESLDRLIYDADHRQACEIKIERGFQPRSWRQVSNQVLDIVAKTTPQPPIGVRPPRVELGAFHDLGRNTATSVWPGMRLAEVFRTGTGWWSQDDFGCWAKPQGGELEFSVAPVPSALRVHLRLRGPPIRSTRFRIEVDGEMAATGLLAANEHRWVAIYIPPVHGTDRRHRVLLYGETSTNLADCTDGQDRRTVSVGLAGFFICEKDDAMARVAFLEAVTLDNLKEIAFGREATESLY